MAVARIAPLFLAAVAGAACRGGPEVEVVPMPAPDKTPPWIAPGKPMMIGETASTEVGGSKAAWITDLLTRQLPQRFPKVHALVWFDKRWDGMDWPISTSPAARDAFRHAIAAPRYETSRFAGLAGAPF